MRLCAGARVCMCVRWQRGRRRCLGAWKLNPRELGSWISEDHSVYWCQARRTNLPTCPLPKRVSFVSFGSFGSFVRIPLSLSAPHARPPTAPRLPSPSPSLALSCENFHKLKLNEGKKISAKEAGEYSRRQKKVPSKFGLTTAGSELATLE